MVETFPKEIFENVQRKFNKKIIASNGIFNIWKKLCFL